MPDREDDPGRRRAALAALYDAHAVGLYRYALMILANAAEAQDAVQQAFTKYMDRRGLAVLSEADYLRTAVRNECFSAFRRRRRDHPPAASSCLLEPVAPGALPDERLALEDALRALPPEQREVIQMKVYEGMTFEEIASRTGVSVNTASRYRYALARLRECLAPLEDRHGR